MVSVLLIDDDTELSKLLEEYLQSEQFELDAAHDGPSGLDKALATHYAAVILDVMLPGMSGLDVLKQLRQKSSVPVLMLTARGSELDRILGLELGADDYLPKPFNPRELVARLRAILRRAAGAGGAASTQPIHLAGVELHPESRSVTCVGKPVNLTGAEFDLLYTFLRNPGKIITREDLTQAALGRPMSPMDRSIDVHVSNLRRKLGSYDGDPGTHQGHSRQRLCLSSSRGADVKYRSLFWKIFFCFWLAAAAMIGALNVMLWLSFANDPNPERRRGALGEALNLYAESAVQVYDSEGPQSFAEYVRRSLSEAGTEIALFDGNGKPLVAQASPEVASAAAEIQQSQQHVSHVTTLGRLTWGRTVVAPSGKTYIFVSRLRQPYVPRGLPRLGIALSILAAGIISYLLALYLTSPVKKLKTVVQSFAVGNLDVRVAPQLGNRKDELADLGREFDHMAERIAALISSQKRLLADISHELRSPLARLTVALELARKNVTGKGVSALDRIELESERVNKLVGQLLALTRLESGAERVPPENVALEDLVQAGDRRRRL